MKRKNKHVNTRIYRTKAPISKFDIKKNIDNGNYKVIKKVSVARRLAYVYVDNYIVKIIMDKNTKDIITIIPINYQYKKEFDFDINKKRYKLILFPDCYMETLDCRMLTIFQILNKNNEWEPIKMKGKLFQSLFNMCWLQYKTND